MAKQNNKNYQTRKFKTNYDQMDLTQQKERILSISYWNHILFTQQQSNDIWVIINRKIIEWSLLIYWVKNAVFLV